MKGGGGADPDWLDDRMMEQFLQYLYTGYKHTATHQHNHIEWLLCFAFVIVMNPRQ